MSAGWKRSDKEQQRLRAERERQRHMDTHEAKLDRERAREQRLDRIIGAIDDLLTGRARLTRTDTMAGEFWSIDPSPATTTTGD